MPYKIKPYQEILKNPYQTIEFDEGLEKIVENRIESLGVDGKLVFTGKEEILYVNLMEKLLVPVLAKLSNFVPGAGIWMNTQRPEWNDANNALVGHGVSMVTLYYLRRHLNFLKELVTGASYDVYELSVPVLSFFRQLHVIFMELEDKNDLPAEKYRKFVMDELGKVFTKYKESIYGESLDGRKQEIEKGEILGFMDLALQNIDSTIQGSKREDGLYHSYNLLVFEEEGIGIKYLHEMLEGQVAMLSSGYLSVKGAIKLIKSLRRSRLYREDQDSYMLYPDKHVKPFTEKNIVPEKEINFNPLLVKLLKDDDKSIIEKDIEGKYHFNGDFKNERDIKCQLEEIKNKGYTELVEKHGKEVIKLYEDIFDHHSFTGRSGSFFKYEGLGCIYWHMVSKLALAVMELLKRAIDEKQPRETVSEVKRLYQEIKEGIGVHKNPAAYGAFPTDAYSHTPGFAGVQQPGLTGQVKEDIISRWGELGISIKDTRLSFNPLLVNPVEYIQEEREARYYDIAGYKQSLLLNEKSLFFTFCGVPVIYENNGGQGVTVYKKKESPRKFQSFELPTLWANEVFQRNGAIEKILVEF